MVERLIKQTKATIESIKRYLAENEGNLSEEEINEALEEPRGRPRSIPIRTTGTT